MEPRATAAGFLGILSEHSLVTALTNISALIASMEGFNLGLMVAVVASAIVCALLNYVLHGVVHGGFGEGVLCVSLT